MTTNTTLGQAVKQYFRENGFGEDGGYDDAWVDFELGPIPMPFPNTEGRKRAVRFHDLHHILTGYKTDTLGEFEISAWELGAGCKGFPTALVINAGGMASGLLMAPKRTFRAFMRGRASRSLYGETYEEVVCETVEEARTKRIAETGEVTFENVLRFVGFGLFGLTFGTALLVLLLPLVPIGIVNVIRMRRAKAAAAAASGKVALG